VIVDGPPVGEVADAMPLLRMVGGVLVVTRIGFVTREGLEELRHNLEVSGARAVGVVTNAVKRKRRASYSPLKSR
jgi:Mrp family chromosome partitioning ATPase